MEKYIAKYREMTAQGVCAHAAACLVVGALYSDCRDQGLSYEQSLSQGRKLFKQLVIFREEVQDENPL